MHPDHGVPVVVGKIDEHPVAEHAGVVDEGVQAAELVKRGRQ